MKLIPLHSERGDDLHLPLRQQNIRCFKDVKRKMKVIFVIQGEGRGHLTQALALKQMLLHEGHEVVKVLVGKSKNRVIPEFFQDKIGTPVEVFDSPNFLPSKDNRKFNLLRSLAYNTLLVPGYLSSIHLIRKNIQESEPTSSSISTRCCAALPVPFSVSEFRRFASVISTSSSIPLSRCLESIRYQNPY